jgi:hypothetical protein
MSIEVTCPNGHWLRIKEKYAGKQGGCPICRAPVCVPVKDNVSVPRAPTPPVIVMNETAVGRQCR